MSERMDIERAILDEEAMLEQVARLLESGADLASWSQATRTALALALEDPSMSRTEHWKAVALRGELIHYERPDAAGPKLSEYQIVSTPAPDDLRAVLTRAYGAAGRVRKHRRLYLVGNTRIHLDQVEDLGSFLELEVVLTPEQSTEEGEAIARQLLAQLGVPETSLLRGAYIDLLRER